MYWLLGGDKPLKSGAYFATVLMAVSAGLGITGLVRFLNEPTAVWAERADWVRLGKTATADPTEWDRQRMADRAGNRPRTGRCRGSRSAWRWATRSTTSPP